MKLLNLREIYVEQIAPHSTPAPWPHECAAISPKLQESIRDKTSMTLLQLWEMRDITYSSIYDESVYEFYAKKAIEELHQELLAL